ncbi:Phosphoenolpyruvate/pyruvate domain-containing protein [Fistulina hepatica ATCC 64428]|uniref:Phosphoenolpyruvate/pyruvate domain-containing protein n=1 Tax=Fistulina hepatica ATCC 64428 TaxID=1128425 RepID=A0A0D7AN27_9AGAR|nr:Phosphoenolpyruvate/pyruvate domain-containing protein [Fistulina hepatica ATCC 64428]
MPESIICPLRRAIKAQKPALGAWITFPGAAVARTVARTPGITWALIDAEHGLITDSDYYNMVNAVAACGVSPIIRIPSDEAWMVKRALDSGAHGVMVPMVNSTEIAAKIVSACKYPPEGIRGFGPMFTHAAGALGDDYKATANDDLVIAVQIENPNSVKEIDAILTTGVDVAFIGPFDLSVSMNVPFGSPEHEGAIEKIRLACKKAGKTSAIFCLNGEQAKMRLAQGFDMVSVSTDIDSLGNFLTAAFATAQS